MDFSNWPLGAFILAVLAWAGREGIGVYLRVRGQRMAEREYADKQEVTGHEVLIARLSVDLDEVRKSLVAVQHDHLDCVKKTGMLEGKCAALETLNAANEKRLESMDKEIESLREWRHAIANDAQHLATTKALELITQSGAMPIVKKD